MSKRIISHKNTYPIHSAVRQILDVHSIPLQKLITRLRKENIVTNNWISETINKDPSYISRELNVLGKKGEVMRDLIDLWWEKYPKLSYEEFEKTVKK